MMGAKSSIVPFATLKKRASGDVSSTTAPVTEAERVVIRMLARRAARKWLAEMARAPRSTEPDPR
jgi:hypothetical protein